MLWQSCGSPAAADPHGARRIAIACPDLLIGHTAAHRSCIMHRSCITHRAIVAHRPSVSNRAIIARWAVIARRVIITRPSVDAAVAIDTAVSSMPAIAAPPVIARLVQKAGIDALTSLRRRGPARGHRCGIAGRGSCQGSCEQGQASDRDGLEAVRLGPEEEALVRRMRDDNEIEMESAVLARKR